MCPRVRCWGSIRLILLYFRPQAPVSRRTQHGKYISAGYAASALNAALGLRATRVRSEHAAGSGSTRPCSQLRSVASGMRKARANSAWVMPSLFRRICGGNHGHKPCERICGVLTVLDHVPADAGFRGRVNFCFVGPWLHPADLLHCSANACHSFRSFLFALRAEMISRDTL
jgi:hypothetical protein